jgi:hypothetical protein
MDETYMVNTFYVIFRNEENIFCKFSGKSGKTLCFKVIGPTKEQMRKYNINSKLDDRQTLRIPVYELDDLSMTTHIMRVD